MSLTVLIHSWGPLPDGPWGFLHFYILASELGDTGRAEREQGART